MPVLSHKKFYIFVLTSLLVLFGLILLYSDHGLIHLKELRFEKERLKLANEELIEKNRRLLRQIERLKTDPRYIEDEARKKLGLIRPDEKIYRLDEEPDLPALSSSPN